MFRSPFLSVAAALALAGAALAFPASAESTFSDSADVLSSEPIYKTARVKVPQRECWDEQASSGGSMTAEIAGTVIGGVAGGVVGHQIGKGRGNDIATAAGAVAGAMAGRSVAQNRYPSDTEVRTRCNETTRYESEDVVSGYRVTYRYMGQTFQTTTRDRPGSQIPVRVSVRAGP